MNGFGHVYKSPASAFNMTALAFSFFFLSMPETSEKYPGIFFQSDVVALGGVADGHEREKFGNIRSPQNPQ